MQEIARLLAEVEAARLRFLAQVDGLSSLQGAYKPSEAAWSVAEITEHLVLAEQGGILMIWKAADGVRRGAPIWSGEPVNRGLSIEEVVARTWKPRETAPESATPRMGGPLACWVAALTSCRVQLEALGEALQGLDLSAVIYPHVLSGPLDARQRLAFLRFHLDRHARQVQAVKAAPSFPDA